MRVDEEKSEISLELVNGVGRAANPMKHSFLVLLLALAACRPSANRVPDASAPPPADAADAAVEASAAVEQTPSEEKPPATEPAAPVMPATVEEQKTVTLEGIYGPAEERARSESEDEGACTDPMKLDHVVKVVDKKGHPVKDGRGVGAHPVIGTTSRVCLWSWTQYAAGYKPSVPWGSHVVVRGTLWPPIVRSNPRAILVFDLELVSATPPPAPAPPGGFPDGDSLVFVRTIDPATRTLGLDLAYPYHGDAAAQLAAARKEPAPDVRRGYIANDSAQLRSLVLPPGVRAEGVGDTPGSGWRSIPLADLNKPHVEPFILTLDKGAVKSLRRVNP